MNEKKYVIFRKRGFGGPAGMVRLMGPLTLEQVQHIEDKADTDDDIICLLTPCDVTGSILTDELVESGNWPLR